MFSKKEKKTCGRVGYKMMIHSHIYIFMSDALSHIYIYVRITFLLNCLPNVNAQFFSFRRFIQRAPLPFLQSVAIKPVLMCAIAACSLDHKDANASVMKFITEFVKASSSKDVSDFVFGITIIDDSNTSKNMN